MMVLWTVMMELNNYLVMKASLDAFFFTENSSNDKIIQVGDYGFEESIRNTITKY